MKKCQKFFFKKSVQEAWFIYYILRPLHPPIVKIFFFGCFPGHLAFCFNTGLYLSAFCFNTGSEKGPKKMLHFLFLTLGSQVTRGFLTIKPFTSLNRPQFFFSLGNAHFLKRLQYQIVVLKLEKLRFVVQTGAVNKYS